MAQEHYLVGIIGDPVAHSRSPAMHNAAFAHLGIEATYERWHTPAAELPARIESLRASHILGASVTLPHKAAVIPLLDALEPEAAQIGAVNTIYKRQDGSLVGANTDAPGLLADLRDAGNFEPPGQQVMILGASGAARAAAFALANAGVALLVVANRTLERAETLLADLEASIWEREINETREVYDIPPPSLRLMALPLDDPSLPDTLAACGLLINATSLGWHSNDETPLPDVPVLPDTLVYDMVYKPTRLLCEAAERGARTLDGSGMLVRQGALAFVRWTGQQPPLDVMDAEVRKP